MKTKVKTKKSASTRIGEKTLAMRKKLWPEIDDDIIWNRKRNTGFTTIPRGMPYIMQIMDFMSSGKPVSQAYLTLWCRTYDEYMITITNPQTMAFESGFTGQRSGTTWKRRMEILEELGFIKSKSGASGTFNYVLILNPYLIIKKIKEEGKMIPENIYNGLLQRANDIGAKELF